jgi:hypothetical protein
MATVNDLQVGDVIEVMPPDRIACEGFEAKILAIDDCTITYQLLDTEETFTVSELVFKACQATLRINKGKTESRQVVGEYIMGVRDHRSR